MSVKIEGKTAFVTGSNRGIGRAIVHALLERGVKRVYAGARKPESLNELVAANKERVVPVPLDVTSVSQVAAAAERAGDTELLFNNAGVALNPEFAGALDLVRQEFEVNYFGVLNMTQAFAPILKHNGGGAIVNVSSVAGLVAFPMFPTYSDSKAAVHSLTTGSRLMLAAQKTLVVGVYPGPIDTDMARELPFEKTAPAAAAGAILDAVAADQTDVFPDPMSQDFIEPFEAGAKTLERRTALMLAEG